MSTVEATRRVVALQAQHPASPYVALWSRVAGFDPSTLDAAFADGAIVKASLMRITLHAVVSEDYPPFHEAMLPNLRASRLFDRRFRETGLSAELVDELLPDVLEFTRRPRTREEIEVMLGERLGSEPDPRLWWAMKTFAPLHHAPTEGHWSFGVRPVYRSAPEIHRGSVEESLRHLICRYLQGFGPASVADVAQFSMLQRSPIRAALAAMGDQVVRQEGPDGDVLYDVVGASVPAEDVAAPPRLLAMWDSTLLAYADRSRILPDELRKVVIRNNGDVLPSLLVDGTVCGVWRPVHAGIEVTSFRPLDASTWDSIEREAIDLMGMLSGREHLVYRRFDNWWRKLPDGHSRVFAPT